MSKPDSHYSIEVSNIRASDENTTNAEKSDSLESSGRVYNPDCPHTPTDGHNIDVALPLSRPEEAVVSQLHESSLLDVNDDLHADAPNLIAVEQSLWTRNYCLGALALTWVLGVALLVAGIILLLHPQPAWMSHGSRTEIATIATNVCLTAILEGDGFIHATALRWALHSDRQLTFNSNLRLFTSSPSSKSNSWYCNFAYAIATVIAYAAASLLFQRALNKTGVTTVHPAALLLLGATLLPIAALVTWSYIAVKVPTWSSCPLNTVLAMLHLETLHRRRHRGMLNVLDTNTASKAVLPRPHQPSAWSSHREVKKLLFFQWGTLFVCPIGALGVYLAMKAGHNKDLREVNWKWDWTFITNIDTSPSWTIYLNTGKISGNDIYCFPDELDSAGDFVPRYWSEGAIVQVLLVAATQTIVTLAMLAAELLVNLQRDETVWRRAASQKGCRLASYNSTAEVIKSPFALFLFGAKAFIHWYFGQAIIPTYDAVNCWKTGWFATGKPYIRFELAQLIYLTVLMLVLTLVFTWLSFRRPYGPQPATYGHLQTLADLIDEWHPTLYWGDKTANAINYAGTSGHALPDIIMGEPYW